MTSARKAQVLSAVARAWVLVVVVAATVIGGFVIFRLHGVFGSDRGASGEIHTENIVSTIPKFVVYEVDGPVGTTGMVSYIDEHSQSQQERFTSLPWSHTLVT